MDGKRCPRCLVFKTASSFSKEVGRKDGLRYDCKVCQRASMEVWRSKNQALVKAEASRRRESGETARSQARYRSRHPERVAEVARRRAIRLKRPRPPPLIAAERRQQRARWSKSNPESVRASKHRNRAKRLAAEGSYTKSELVALLDKQRRCCAVCRAPVGSAYEADHIVPIAKGGSNFITNIQILCRPCNRTKSDKDPIHFMQQRGFLL
jgi:5-methylcytosine-specific restriction endonuclease McrA